MNHRHAASGGVRRAPLRSVRELLAAAACVVALCAASLAHAGGGCRERTTTPAQLAQAAGDALRTAAALDAADAPVALLARVGTDLSQHGLVYSHVGFALRDHADGRWTVVHLLNTCGTPRSSLYAEGLVEFLADDLVDRRVRISWLREPLQAQVLQAFASGVPQALHVPRYNVIAPPQRTRSQNSTAWVLELLAAANASSAVTTRSQAQARWLADGHVPDVVHIPYSQRVLGGMFGANVAFGEHPVATRLAGDYPVVTVRSILRWLRAQDAIADEREWDAEGRERAVPGPA